MRLYNKGKRHIQHAEAKDAGGRLIPGAQCLPGKVFSVSDKLGKTLKKIYHSELESLDDAQARFSDSKQASSVAADAAASAAAPPVAIPFAEAKEVETPHAAAGDSLDPPATDEEKAEAAHNGVSVADLRHYREHKASLERDSE